MVRAGTAAAGLKGSVRPDDFKAVLKGQVPHGPQLGRMVDGKLHHAPGWDLTFSAPKSLSILAEVLDRDDLRALHDKAVRSALTALEKNVLETRIWNRETKSQEVAGDQQAVIATFQHAVSRDEDPQLHTHAVVANMAKGPDGQWRSVHSKAVYEQKMALGLHYRSELAANLRNQGFAIETTGRHGTFEIVGVPKEVREVFSSRRQAIENELERRGQSGAKDAAKAALQTRSTKRSVALKTLRERWLETSRSLGVDLARVAEKAQNKGRHTTSPKAARGSVEDAIAHLSERSAAFTRAELTTQATIFSLGKARPAQIERAVKEALGKSALKATDRRYEGYLTTPLALDREDQTLALGRDKRGEMRPIVSRRKIDRNLENGSYNAGQKEAVRTALLSLDRVIGVQGRAGTGKTHMLGAVSQLAQKAGFQVVGMAPTTAATKELSTHTETSMTLSAFLARRGRVGPRKDPANLSRSVLIVDEASMVSTSQMHDLMALASSGNAARVVLVGDTKQLSAIDAGNPFAALQKDGLETASMDEIIRQKNPATKAAVEAAIGGEIRDAIASLDKDVMEHDRSLLAEKAARQWLRYVPEDRDRVGVVAPTNALKLETTAAIRTGLKAEGQLTGDTVTIATKTKIPFTTVETGRAESYEAGQTVRFHRDYKRLGIQKGNDAKVVSSDPEAGFVTLTIGERTIEWSPSQLAGRTKGAVSVYEERTLELAENDKVRFTENDPKGAFINGTEASVLSMTNDGLYLDFGNRKWVEFKADDPGLSSLTHDYAHTVHAFQGQTRDNMIVVADSQNQHLTNQQSFYVALSRARYEVEILTDGRENLIDAIERNTGEKIAARDVVPKECDHAEAHSLLGLVEDDDRSSEPEVTREVPGSVSAWIEQIRGGKNEQARDLDADEKKKDRGIEIEL